MSSPSPESVHQTYDRLAQRLVQQLRQPTKRQSDASLQYWVAIAGGAGSGKSTSAHEIATRVNCQVRGDCCAVVPADGFHYSQAKLTELHGPEAILQRGAPFTFDAEGLFQALQTAKHTGEASLPSYCRIRSDPIPDCVRIHRHHRIILVEGLYLLHQNDPRWAPLGDLWDERWYVRAPTQEIQLQRLVSRSMETWTDSKAKLWGSGQEGATKRVHTNDLPNIKLIEYCETLADEVIITYAE